MAIFSIRLSPELVAIDGWRYAFAALAIGPLLGIIAIRRMQRIEAYGKLDNRLTSQHHNNTGEGKPGE